MSYILVHECVAPNRDCIYGSCLRPMHRKLLQEAVMAVAFVMRAGDDDYHGRVLFQLDFVHKQM